MELNSTGAVRRIDDLGRIVIPKEIRRKVGICEGDPLEIFICENFLVLKLYDTEHKALSFVQCIEEIVRTNMNIPSASVSDILAKVNELSLAIKDAEKGKLEEAQKNDK